MKIKSSVSKDKSNNPDDVLAVKVALASLGYYETPDYGLTSYPDKAMFAGIKKLQKDWGLKQDGVVKPSGETEQKIKGVLGKSPIQRCVTCGGPHGGSHGDQCEFCANK